MTTPPPDSFLTARLSLAHAVLMKRVAIDRPITEAEAMKFVRFAYMHGYWDAVTGIAPNEHEAERSTP